eukprot:359193-Chlamydomonas_euryale.AAC.3
MSAHTPMHATMHAPTHPCTHLFINRVCTHPPTHPRIHPPCGRHYVCCARTCHTAAFTQTHSPCASTATLSVVQSATPEHPPPYVLTPIDSPCRLVNLCSGLMLRSAALASHTNAAVPCEPQPTSPAPSSPCAPG